MSEESRHSLFELAIRTAADVYKTNVRVGMELFKAGAFGEPPPMPRRRPAPEGGSLMPVALVLAGAGLLFWRYRSCGGFSPRCMVGMDSFSAASGDLIGKATALGMRVIRGEKGYVKGTPRDIDIAEVAPDKFLELQAAIAYKAMEAAARAAGHDLGIASGFRSMATQERLWAERMNPDGTKNETGKRLGQAARPGYSNHQSGIAVDLGTGGMSWGPIRPVYWWLADNAAKFGFRRTVSNEAWHWDYRPDWTGHNFVSEEVLRNPS